MSAAVGMGTYFAAKTSTEAGVGAFLAMVAFNVSEGVVIGMDRRSNMERGCMRGLAWAWAVCAMEMVGILIGFGLLEVGCASGPILALFFCMLIWVGGGVRPSTTSA